jgi:ferredoxin
MACIKACPAQAFSSDRTVKVNLAGHDVEWADIDIDKCSYCFRGAKDSGEVQEHPYTQKFPTSVPGDWSPFFHQPSNLYKTGIAICGSRGCTRACMISLEQRGVLQNTFKEKFRRRPTWKVDWSTPPEYAPGTLFKKNEDDVD